MTSNKLTVKKYIDGFTEGDNVKILSCLTNEIEWYMPGYFQLSGKPAFEKEINNDNFIGLPLIRIIRMVEEDNIVIAEGEVQCTMKAGGVLNALFCDVFHMEEGKIKRLTTYQMNK